MCDGDHENIHSKWPPSARIVAFMFDIYSYIFNAIKNHIFIETQILVLFNSMALYSVFHLEINKMILKLIKTKFKLISIIGFGKKTHFKILLNSL